MSKQLTQYWETVDLPFDEFEKQGLNLDDLLVKTKFNFKGSKFTFSSKSKFNWGASGSASHEYGLKHKCQGATFDFKHKAGGETSLETDAKCLQKDDVQVFSYSKLVLDQGEDRNNFKATVMWRLHHKNNALVSFGVEDWNPSSGSPSTVSAYGSYGHVHDGANLSFNSYFNFDVKKKFLPLAKVLISAQKDKTTGYFQTNVVRTEVETDDKENPKVTSQAIDFVAKVIHEVDSDHKVGGVVNYNLESKKSDFSLLGMHKTDRVRFNGKLSSDRTLSLGITSQHDDVTINFAAKSALKSATEKVEKDGADNTRYWVTYKFGMSAEFNRL